MPAGWDTYYVVVLSAFLALGIPLTFWSFSLVLRRLGKRKLLVSELRTEDSRRADLLAGRMNSRFFWAASTAVLLFCLILLLIPCATLLRAGNTPLYLVKRAMVVFLTFGGLGGLSLLYAVKKGDLSWSETFREEE